MPTTTNSAAALNNDLYPHVRAGDLVAREQMILNNMHFARWLTYAYLRCWPQYIFLRSDLESAAFVGLINGVDGLKHHAKGKVNPSGYISRAIKRQLSATARGEDLSPSGADVNRLPQRPNGVPELLDTILAACETDLDRQLVLLRAERYTFREVGVLIHVNYSTLCTWLKRIKARFDAITATN